MKTNGRCYVGVKEIQWHKYKGGEGAGGRGAGARRGSRAAREEWRGAEGRGAAPEERGEGCLGPLWGLAGSAVDLPGAQPFPGSVSVGFP